MLKNKKMLNRLRRMMDGNMENVEDCIQDSFVKYLERKKEGLVLKKEHPKHYFYMILNNTAKDRLNRMNRHEFKTYSIDSVLKPVFSDTQKETPESILYKQRRHEFLREKIAEFCEGLPPNQQKIFKVRMNCESHLEASRILNINYETCKTQYKIALKKLKKEAESWSL